MDIKAVYMILTEQCNLRCKYCYETHGTRRMSLDVAKATVDFLMRGASRELDIMLFGGEPTLEYKLIVQLVDYILEIQKGRDIMLEMVSNCTQFPEELQEALKKWFQAGNRMHVQLSIDGPEEVQDAYRVRPDGTGSWNTVKPTMDIWKELERNHGNLEVTVHGCLNKQTIGKLWDTYNYFREDLGVKKLWYLPVSEEDWAPEDVEAYRDGLKMITKDIKRRCMESKSLDELYYYSPLNKCLNERLGRGKPCAAGTSFMSVAPNGTLYPCHQIAMNTPEGSCGDIWKGVDEMSRLLYMHYDDTDFEQCRNCEHDSCFRCIAHNFDARGCIVGLPKAIYCRFMLADKEMIEELRAFRKEIENNGFV